MRDRHERLFLIFACVFAAGALAIPRLRRSQAFSPRAKVVLGTLAVLQTLAAFAFVGVLVWKGPELFSWWMAYVRRESARQRRF